MFMVHRRLHCIMEYKIVMAVDSVFIGGSLYFFQFKYNIKGEIRAI